MSDRHAHRYGLRSLSDPLLDRDDPLRGELYHRFLRLRRTVPDHRDLTGRLMGEPNPATGRGVWTVPAAEVLAE